MSRRIRTLAGLGALAAAVFGAVALTLLALRGGQHVAPAAAAPPAAAFTAQAEVAEAQAAADADPGSPAAQAALASAALDMARETADPSWYAKAESAARLALRADPRTPEALDAMSTLALARHRFAVGLAWARRSLAAEPDRVAPLGLAGDALIELGRYPQAFATVRRRLLLRPDLASYSRASYVEELQGNRAGATQLMALAVDAGRPGSSGRAWARVQLGLLHLGSGRPAAAEREMRTALRERPGDPTALAGLGRVLAARGRLAAAATAYRAAVDRLPLPEHAAALADVERARGHAAAAAEARALVGVTERLLRANGVRTDLDLALIDADAHRPGPAAVRRARAARALRPGVVGDQVLGWVLTRAGRCDEGLRHARASLRLGTRDALMLFHAGMAAACAGLPTEAASRLREALALNPGFSVRWAPVARRTLARLEAAA